MEFIKIKLSECRLDKATFIRIANEAGSPRP